MKARQWLLSSAGSAVPRLISMVFAGMAAALFFASAVFQQRASHARWVTALETQGPDSLSIESHEYDYYLPIAGYIPLPDTGVPLGIGLMLQSAGVFMLLLCLLSAARPSDKIMLSLQLLLGLLVIPGYAIIGDNAIRSELAGVPADLNWSSPVLLTTEFAFVPLIDLCVLCWRWFPVLAVACFFLLGTTILGNIIIYLLVAPLVTGYTSHDTTPGTETIMALSTAAAGVAMLVVIFALISRRRGLRANALTAGIAAGATNNPPAG
ncbi:hypothetical protein ACF046_01170 [Glutamicibacter creatinolyticus]|uniref:hypothetical protein n=1 Tax=Glutamicibacter creatinolyticus TaxID=162496 RepID=UPI0034010F10